MVVKVVQKTVNAETGEAVVKTLGLMGVNDTFGEVSFLLGGAATASVVAATDDVEVRQFIESRSVGLTAR